MQISSNTRSYDSIIQDNKSITQTKASSSVKEFLEAFRVDFSINALQSREFEDSSINFPTHNPEVLQYSDNLELTKKLY